MRVSTTFPTVQHPGEVGFCEPCPQNLYEMMVPLSHLDVGHRVMSAGCKRVKISSLIRLIVDIEEALSTRRILCKENGTELCCF